MASLFNNYLLNKDWDKWESPQTKILVIIPIISANILSFSKLCCNKEAKYNCIHWHYHFAFIKNTIAYYLIFKYHYFSHTQGYAKCLYTKIEEGDQRKLQKRAFYLIKHSFSLIFILILINLVSLNSSRYNLVLWI